MTPQCSQFFRSAVLLTSLLGLAGCNDGSGDPKAQIGANPTLPDVRQFLFPPMHIAHVVGWKKGETPSVPKGLKIEALATGLQHPRMLYSLPNGDVLVVDPPPVRHRLAVALPAPRRVGPLRPARALRGFRAEHHLRAHLANAVPDSPRLPLPGTASAR